MVKPGADLMPATSSDQQPLTPVRRTPTPLPRRRLPLAVSALLGLLLFALLYARTVRYAFVWDDVGTLAQTSFFDRPLGEVLRTSEHARMDESLASLRGGLALGHESYRPVNVFTHWLDIRLFGHQPGPMHAHGLLWALAGIALAYAVAARLLGGGGVWPLLVAAVFALHPLHVEPFAYVSARADLVCGALTLAAALLFLRGYPAVAPPPPAGRRALWLAAACVVYLLALFAKEVAIALPLALLGCALALARTQTWAPGLGALAATAVLHFPLRAALVPTAPLTGGASARAALLQAPGVALQYLGQLLAPFGISNARPLDATLTRPGWALVALAAVALAGAVFWRRRAWAKGAAPAARDLALAVAGLIWVGLFVAPAAVAVGTLGALADRYAYLPVFGFALAVVALLRAAWSELIGQRLGQRALLAFMALWVVLLALISAREIPAWRDNWSLYTHAVMTEPESPIAHYRLGVVLAGAARWDEAAAAFTSAETLKRRGLSESAPALDRVLNNLGVAQMNLGRNAEAEATFQRAITSTGNSSYRAWYNVALLRGKRGDTAGACAALDQALALNPAYERARTTHASSCAAAQGEARRAGNSAPTAR